jgi:hypothetical protein
MAPPEPRGKGVVYSPQATRTRPVRSREDGEGRAALTHLAFEDTHTRRIRINPLQGLRSQGPHGNMGP